MLLAPSLCGCDLIHVSIVLVRTPLFSIQLIKFYRSNDFSLDRLSNFTFLGQELRFSQSVVHLGHILNNDLSDKDDIASVKKDLCSKTNCMLHIFSSCNPLIKTKLF